MTLRKDNLWETRLQEMGLNERQVLIMHYIRRNGSINNTEHQTVTGAARRTAARDLEYLEEIGLLQRSGLLGRSVHYVINPASDINVPNVPSNVP